jgi:hypothetical protein
MLADRNRRCDAAGEQCVLTRESTVAVAQGAHLQRIPFVSPPAARVAGGEWRRHGRDDAGEDRQWW